jgi:hypothetical protein
MTLKKLISTSAIGFMLVASPAYAAPAHSGEHFRSGLDPSSVSGPSALAAWEDFDGGFETGDFSQYLEVQAAAGRATVVKSPVGEGTYAARFERRVGDELIAGSNRSEAVPKPEFGAGETRYFRHLLYLPFGSIDWNHFLILCQWHDSSAGAPPLSLQTFEKEGTKELLIGSGTQKSIYYEFDIPGDAQWFELVYRITFGAKGSMEVWLDGKSLGEVTEIDTLGTEPTNWKLGNYRSSEAEGTTVVFQDGVMITKSFFSNPPDESAEDAVVAPVASPQPSPSADSQAPDVDAKPCQLAKGELRKARVRLSVARRRFGNSSLQAQRRRWAKRVNQSAKSFQLAKRRVRRICQA